MGALWGDKTETFGLIEMNKWLIINENICDKQLYFLFYCMCIVSVLCKEKQAFCKRQK